MAPETFVMKWRVPSGTERGAALSYFLDLAILLGVFRPIGHGAHQAVDEAVVATCSRRWSMADEEAPSKLVALILARHEGM